MSKSVTHPYRLSQDVAILQDARSAAGDLDSRVGRLVNDASLVDGSRVRAGEALGLALDLISEAGRRAAPDENRRRTELGRLSDPAVSVLARALPERVFRPTDRFLQWRAMHEVVVEGTGIPEALPLHERPFLWLASRWPGRVFRTLAMPAVRYEIRRRVGGFVEIRRTNDPAQIVDQLRQESSRTGVGAEINLVVEAAATDEEAAKALAWYKGAVVAGASRVAIKPTALVPLSGSAVATTPSSGKLAAALKDIFRIADERRDADNVSVTEISIDSERSDILDMTRIAVLAVAAAYPRVRVKMAMQAYLRDTESRLLDPFLDASARRVREGGVPLGARLVCGANTEGEELLASQMGWDSTPLVSSRSATHANYFRLMRRMLKPILKGEFTVTHASMNVVTVAHHLVELAKAGVFASEHSGAVSFAMLRGMMGQGIFRVLTERYGVQCHEYVPVISRDRVVELFKYYLRRIEEIAGSNPEHATANYLGLTCAFGADSDQWRSTQVEHGFLAALGLDDRQEQEGAYPLKPGVQPNRGEHEPFVSDEASEFRITPALNAGAEDTRLWIEARSRACVDREERDAPRIRPLWYDKRTRETRVLMGPTRPELVLAVADMATKEDIDRAFEIAEMDRTGWGVKPMLDRLAILSAAEREIASTREKLVECLMLDAGKSVTEADAEVDETRDFLRLTVRQWKALLARDQLVVSPGGNGTAVVVCPKNFPQAIPAAHVAALLASGHRVIIKPSGGEHEETILSTSEMVNCFHRAGVPEEVLLLLLCDNARASVLTSHPKAERVRFTGSPDTARGIQQGKPDLDLLAETGAQNVAIVDSSVDLKEAALQIVQSVCGYAGQKCSKIRLVVLTGDVDATAFRKHLIGIMDKLLPGTAIVPNVDITPLRVVPPTDHPLHERLTKCEPGERWIHEPAVPGLPGVREVDDTFDVSTLKEIFAPIVTIMQIQGGVKSAVTIANAVRGSLTGSLYSRMQANIDYALRHWQTGNLYINRHSTGARADQGFGDGFGSESHRGAHGGKTGTQEFLLLNALIRRDPARVVPWERVATDSTGLQRGLDVIDAHLRSSLEAETGDAPEEMMSLRRAIDAGRSYLHESATYFSRRRPAPYKVKGQDDWIESRSIGYVCLRAHPADDPFDLLARVFAAIAAGNQLRVSVPPEGEAIFESYLRTFPFDVVPNFPGVTVHVEDDTALFSCLTNDSARPNALNLLQYTARDRVPMAIFTAAANVGLHIDCREATGDGLVDLISQYRQQSVCNVYHVAGDVSYEQYRRGRACPPSDPLSSTN